MNFIRRYIANIEGVQAVLRAAALCPPGYTRCADHLWIDEPEAKGWNVTLAYWAGFLETSPGPTLQPTTHVKLSKLGKKALKTKVKHFLEKE